MSETIHFNAGRNRSTSRAKTAGWRWGGLLLALAVGALLVYALRSNSWHQLNRLEHEFATIRTESFYLGIKLREGIGRLNELALRCQLSRDDATVRERFSAESHRLSALIETTAPHLTTADQREEFAGFKTAYDAYLTNLSVLVERPVRAVRRGACRRLPEAEARRRLQ